MFLTNLLIELRDFLNHRVPCMSLHAFNIQVELEYRRGLKHGSDMMKSKLIHAIADGVFEDYGIVITEQNLTQWLEKYEKRTGHSV